jgi:hypothetical protein
VARTKAERIARFGIVCKDKSLTDQTHKDTCDINRVLDRARRGIGLSHLEQHGSTYGDFSDWDEFTYEDYKNRLARANSVFYDLDAELRSEFDNNPGKFFAFVNDPQNASRLEEIFPALSAPGRQFADVIGGTVTTPSDPGPADTTPTPTEPAQTTPEPTEPTV